MKHMYTFILVLLTTQAWAAGAETKKTYVDTVQIDFKIPVKITEMCDLGGSETGGVMLGCSVSHGGAILKNSKLSDKQFVGDSYFAPEVRVGVETVSFIFIEYDINSPEEYYQEVKSYFDQNEVYYTFTYYGPDMDISDSLGEPVDYVSY